MFDYCVNDEDQFENRREMAWQSLVHVCRRWRSIIFASPRHLKLQLVCQERTPARDMLDVWPALPLIISCFGGYQAGSVDNIIAVLERSGRVCQIKIVNIQSSNLEIILAAMQQPFPELTDLSLQCRETVPVVPDSFLGGSAPRLEYLRLSHIPFPGLPKLLLSATHLVRLRLTNIPHSGYISPKAMVTALSALTSLEELTLEFQSPRSCPDRASPHPPPTRFVLSILKRFTFKGVSEYMEELVARIDSPQLTFLGITFFNDIIYDTPELMQLISRTPISRALHKAHITLRKRDANLYVSSCTSGDGKIEMKILCRGLEWQLSSLEQVYTSCSPFFSMLEDLYIYEDPYSPPDQKDDIENGLWLEPLHPFTTVNNLYISDVIAQRIGSALQELAEGRMTEVLPTLQNIFLVGYPTYRVPEGIEKLVAARRVASRPIVFSDWPNAGRDKVYY